MTATTEDGWNDTGWVNHVTCNAAQTTTDAGGATIQNSAWPARQLGPLRVGRMPTGVGNGNVDSVVPRDPISYWADGTSNQIVLGEKHVPQGYLNVCKTPHYKQVECNALAINGRCVMGLSRRVHPAGRLANGPNDFVPPDPNSTGNQSEYSPAYGYGFGSWHPGICQFLLGDGAVRAVSVTVPMGAILVPLANVADGVSVSLP
jgi:hypothetical protein